MAGRLTILILFLECISFVVVSAFTLPTLRKSHAAARRTTRTRRGRTPAGGLTAGDHLVQQSPHASTSTTCMCPNKNKQQPSHLDADSTKHPLTANMLSRLTPAQLLRLYLLLNRAAPCDVTGAWLPLNLMLQSCKFYEVILEAQVTQICSMDILRLTIDFI